MLAIVLTVGAAIYLFVAGRILQPPRVVATTESSEIGAESPAVASLLTNGFVVTPPAAVATLLDLVARGWLRIEHAEHEVVVLTDRPRREGDVLTGYEQQVLNHVHRLTAGTLTGVSGAGVEIAGLRLVAPLVATVHAVGGGRRPSPAALSSGAGTRCCWSSPAGRSSRSPRWQWWRSVRSGDETAVADSLLPRAIAAAVAVVIVVVAWRLVKRARSQAQRPTAAGLQRAEHWLSRAGVDGAPRVRGGVGGRRQQHQPGARLRRRPRPRRARRRRAADRARGRPHWRGATPPASGTSCGCATRSGPATAATRRFDAARRPGRRRRHRPAAAVAARHRPRRHAGRVIEDDFPDQADLIEDVALVLAAVADRCRCCGWSWLVVAGAFDLFSTIERHGLVVRARRPQRVVPFPRLLAPARPARPVLAVHRRRRRPFRPGHRVAVERAHRGAAGCPGPGARRRRCSATCAGPSRSAATTARRPIDAMPRHDAADPGHQRRRHRLRRAARARPGDARPRRRRRRRTRRRVLRRRSRARRRCT